MNGHDGSAMIIKDSTLLREALVHGISCAGCTLIKVSSAIEVAGKCVV